MSTIKSVAQVISKIHTHQPCAGSKEKDSKPQNVSLHLPIRHINLISNQYLGTGPVPASRARSAQHEAACRINIQARDDACARRAGDNEERHGGVFKSTSIAQVVQAHNIVRCAATAC